MQTFVNKTVSKTRSLSYSLLFTVHCCSLSCSLFTRLKGCCEQSVTLIDTEMPACKCRCYVISYCRVYYQLQHTGCGIANVPDCVRGLSMFAYLCLSVQINQSQVKTHQKYCLLCLQASTSVQHLVLPCHWTQRSTIVADMIKSHGCAGRSIVFTDTKKDANELTASLSENCGAMALHGDIPQVGMPSQLCLLHNFLQFWSQNHKLTEVVMFAGYQLV